MYIENNSLNVYNYTHFVLRSSRNTGFNDNGQDKYCIYYANEKIERFLDM